MQLAPYLFFPGTCEEALNRYCAIFGGTITELNRFGDGPMGEGMSEAQLRMVMHATFVAPGMTFMASDGRGGELMAGKEMTRVRLSIGTADAEEGRRVFDALAEGGTVEMPYEKQFWGASFGMLMDRFGIRWMVNAG